MQLPTLAEAESGKFAGGDGTADNPYQIEDVFDLQNMSDNLSAHYILDNNIDAAETTGWNDGNGFGPLGNSSNNFTGNLDGHDHEITGLFINRTSENDVGLFGCLGTGGSISNVNIVNINISGGWYVGALVGYNSGTVKNCSSTGNVSGVNDVGGLVGYNGATVKNCSTNGSVSGDLSVGGLLGYNENGALENCYSTGNVSGDDRVGGIIGYNDGGTVENCYATGNVNGTGIVGGFVGSSFSGTVGNSYSSGNVSGDDHVGGFVGINSNGGTVEKCYATGNVNGDENVGGLVGSNFNTLQNCYAIGNVSGNDYVGGLVGRKWSSTVENCFWDIKASGLHTSSGGIGRNTTEMMKMSTFTDAGWDFNETWNLIEGISYPYLRSLTLKIMTEDVTEVLEDHVYYVQYNAIDPTNDTLTWQMKTSAEWLLMSREGFLTGTPKNDDVGTFWVHISVSDGKIGLDDTNFTLTVMNTNDPPEITFTPQTTATEDTPYSQMVNATDMDPTNDTLTWKMNTSAVWLELNTTTSKLEGTPTNDDVGSSWVNVSVSDGNGGVDYRNFTLTVANTNDPPEITFIPLTTITEDSPYSLALTTVDIDPTEDTLTWRLNTSAVWLVLNPAASTLEGTPTNNNVGTFWTNVSVSDGNGGRDYSTFTLTVTNTNDPPEITFIPLTTAIEDTPYSLTLTAVDIDPTEDTLIWKLISSSPRLILNTVTSNI